jgi:hypothetical protein
MKNIQHTSRSLLPTALCDAFETLRHYTESSSWLIESGHRCKNLESPHDWLSYYYPSAYRLDALAMLFAWQLRPEQFRTLK